MYKNILIPIAADHGDVSEAIEIARAISADGADLTALTVIEAVPSYVAGYLPEGQIEKTAKEVMTALKSDLEGAEGVTPRVVSGHSANTILDYAKMLPEKKHQRLDFRPLSAYDSTGALC